MVQADLARPVWHGFFQGAVPELRLGAGICEKDAALVLAEKCSHTREQLQAEVAAPRIVLVGWRKQGGDSERLGNLPANDPHRARGAINLESSQGRGSLPGISQRGREPPEPKRRRERTQAGERELEQHAPLGREEFVPF